MKLSAQSHASIASSLREAVDKYIADGERTVVTDIHLQPKQDSGELVIFNDDDEELSRTIIEEWVDYSEDDFYTIVERILRGEINALKDTGVLDKLAIMKPYSFVLVDEDRETVTELLLIDDALNDESEERVGKLNRSIGIVKFPMLFYIIGEENVFSRVAFKILFSHPSVKNHE